MKRDAAAAIVTGGARGIGAAIAVRLGTLGHPVAVVDLKGDEADAVATAIVAAGGRARGYGADVADIADHAQLVAMVTADLGTPLIVVNNAAVGGGERFEAVTPERFDAVFAVSARGAFFLTQALVPGMRAHGFGRIVNVSSLLAARGERGNPHYAGAKAAMAGFTRAWAQELAADGITANTLLPALTDTPMARAAFSPDELARRAALVPAGRLASAEDSAAVVAFLVSPQAGFVNGQAFSANGAEFVGAL